jgi:hypothetical protein
MENVSEFSRTWNKVLKNVSAITWLTKGTDEKCFGVQPNLEQGAEKCFGAHVVNERNRWKCFSSAELEVKKTP